MSVLEIPEFAYHADDLGDTRPSLSRSVIHAMCSKSPAHARAIHPKLNPNVEIEHSRAFDIGSVAHQLLLDTAVGVQVVNADTWRTKASKEQRDEARAHGLIPLLEKEWAEVEAMMEAVRPQLAELDPVPFTDGEAEQTLVWEEDGVLFRARPDWLCGDRPLIWDFKTATNGDPDKWSRSAIDYGYDIQDVIYRRGVKAVHGIDAAMRFVVVEKAPPFCVTVFQFAPDAVALAERKVDWAVGMWRECLRTGVWPGYATDTCWVNAEPWHEARWLDKEARWEAA